MRISVTKAALLNSPAGLEVMFCYDDMLNGSSNAE